MEQCSPIEIMAKEVLMELISKEQEKYPFVTTNSDKEG